VPAANVDTLARAIVDLARDPGRAAALGAAGRLDVERRFSLNAMVGAYQALYDRQLAAVHDDRRNA
jgi:glycosyltransferase involved in cell wall biosynthesis